MSKKPTQSDYLKLRECYLNYLQKYKELNHGSLQGCTPFHIFYNYKTYVIRYMDPNRIILHSYK